VAGLTPMTRFLYSCGSRVIANTTPSVVFSLPTPAQLGDGLERAGLEDRWEAFGRSSPVPEAEAEVSSA